MMATVACPLRKEPANSQLERIRAQGRMRKADQAFVYTLNCATTC
jgi:hypothetical protein